MSAPLLHRALGAGHGAKGILSIQLLELRPPCAPASVHLDLLPNECGCNRNQLIRKLCNHSSRVRLAFGCIIQGALYRARRGLEPH